MTHQRNRPLPPAEDLRIFFNYNPETGDLHRVARRYGRNGMIGSVHPPRKVARVDDWGYYRCDVPGISNAQASRVIWKIQTGEDPGDKQIDHINGNTLDNRWGNLRLVEQHQNQWNVGPQRGKHGRPTRSKYKGVSYVLNDRGEPTYIIARISVNGKRIYLGLFDSEEAAYAAYCEAAKKYHGDYARTA